MLDDSSPNGETAQAWQQRVNDLLRAGRELQTDSSRLRDQGAALRRAIFDPVRGGWGNAEQQRAALYLLEDAESARRATLHENAERRRAEDALLRTARANAFRVMLSDALRPLADPAEIERTAARLLREHLNASRTTYGEVTPAFDGQIITCDHSGGLPPLPQFLPFGAFDPAGIESLKEGRVAVINDISKVVLSSERLEKFRAVAIAACVAVPLLRDGVLVATLNVMHAAPRIWLPDEIAIVEETAGRTWEILERARAQSALRDAEERQRIALEAAGMGAWDYDEISGRLNWNARHYRLCGLEPDGQPWTPADFGRLVHPDDKEIARRWRDSLSGPDARAVEYRIVRPDGAVRWLSSFGHAAAWADGKPTRLSGVTFDVTERREAEATLAATQERLRLILESAHAHGIISLDLQCRIMSWNSGAENITGFVAAEMIGQPIDRILLPEDRASGIPEQEVHEALATGQAVGSRWHQRKDGRLFWSTCALLPMRTPPDGEVVGYVKIFSDETEMQQARHELEQNREELYQALQEAERARAEAEAAGRAKDHFMAVLSHELRTPLMPVMMALGALSRRKDLSAPVRAAHDMIGRNVELEARFIDDMLDVTRIVHGKLEIVRADMDLHEAAARAVEVSHPDLQAKSQRLTVSLKAGEHRVHGDFARLQQAMWNLLKNASKFTPEGGEIALRSRNISGAVMIEIIDHGIGMEPEVIERIFNPFEQADPSIARAFGGLGLGLAIAKATVEAHGGELRAASAGHGRGATFTMKLPAAVGQRSLKTAAAD